MQLYRKDNNKFEINFSAFHSTYEVDTPLHSARQIDYQERQRELELKQVIYFFAKLQSFMIKILDGEYAEGSYGKWSNQYERWLRHP